MNGSVSRANNGNFGFIVEEYGNHSFFYQSYRKKEIKRIKKLLKDNPDIEIYYGNGWIRIGNESFNGFTKEFIKNL